MPEQRKPELRPPAGQGEIESSPPRRVRDALRALHAAIRAQARAEVLAGAGDALSDAPVPAEGDVSYSIDLRAEELIDRFFRSEWAEGPVTVVCEGIGTRTYPASARDSDAAYRVIVDPLDGTRELMYDKRSAWVLTGVARNQGPDTSLADVVYALQTEVPPSSQGVGAVLSASRGGGATRELWVLDAAPRFLGRRPLVPSSATTLWNGYAVFVDFFAPGPRLATSRIAERVLGSLVPPGGENQALVFNDQYLSNAGQIYLLASGAYRFVADLRPLLQPVTVGERRRGICSHPYDLCTFLVATEAGSVITDAAGGALAYRLDTDTDCAWIGYANGAIRALLEGPLMEALAEVTDGGTDRGTGPRTP
ncbi:MAG TPA: inositol monophosphatase [Chloroflexota bacterium]